MFPMKGDVELIYQTKYKKKIKYKKKMNSCSL